MVNKVIVLDDGKKYILLNQAIYNGINYYTAAEVTEDEEDVTGEFTVLKETREGNDIYMQIEKDPETLKILLQYMKVPEVQE